jgi:ATP-dependent Clp protease adaptor protein ClpS
VNSRVDIKLALDVVDPLIDLLREFAQQLSAQDHATVSSRDIAELNAFLDLFSDVKKKRATITIDGSRAPTYVRACSYVRLQLRARHLASIDDKVLEASLDPGAYTGEIHRAVLCYCFLSTIQDVVLTRLGIAQVSRFEWGFPFRQIGAAIARARANSSRAKPPVAKTMMGDVTQVVVLNDPVNTMAYVVAVFRSVVGLSASSATRCMTEVHERQSSVVWSGDRERAEHYAEELKSWHLKVETRSGRP